MALIFTYGSEVKHTMGQEFMGGLRKVKFSRGSEQDGLRRAWDSLQQEVSEMFSLVILPATIWEIPYIYLPF